jgi:outer membrane protein TolC
VITGVVSVNRVLAERSDLKVVRSAIETNTLNVRWLRSESLPEVNVSAGGSHGTKEQWASDPARRRDLSSPGTSGV